MTARKPAPKPAPAPAPVAASRGVNWSSLGGRRFFMAMGAGLMTTVLQWFGKLDAAGMAYVAVITATVGAYIAGNVIETKHQLVHGKQDAPQS